MPLLPRPRKLKHGTYWYAQVKTRNGWRKFNTGQEDRKGAKEVLRRVEAEILAGRDPFSESRGGQTVKERIPDYIRYCEERGLRPATIRSYRSTLALLPDLPTADLAESHVAAIRRQFKTQTSRNIHLRNLRAFLRWAGNPLKISIARTDPASHIDYYSANECRRLLAVDQLTINGFPFRLLVSLLMLTGMRKGEAAQALWEPSGSRPHIDLTQGQIVVPAASAKGRRPRYVPILPDLRPILESWPHRTGALFPFYVHGGEITALWRETCKLAGVRYLKLHNLRDTFAVRLLMAGVPWAVVGEILGHRSVETTKKYYAAIGVDEIRSALSNVPRLERASASD